MADIASCHLVHFVAFEKSYSISELFSYLFRIGKRPAPNPRTWASAKHQRNSRALSTNNDAVSIKLSVV